MLKYQLFKPRENRSIGLTHLKTHLINTKSMEQNIGQCSSQKKQKGRGKWRVIENLLQ